MGRTLKETTHITQRRQRVADLYLKSFTQVAIANELGIAQSTVSSDLKSIRKEWRESSIRDFDALRERELRKIDLLECEAWEAWQRSQQPAESTRVTQNDSGKVAQKTVQHQQGDPRYLDQIHKCIAARRALLGLDAPTRIAPTSPDGEEAYHSYVMAEMIRIAEQAKDGPTIIDTTYVEQELERAMINPDAKEPPQLEGPKTDVHKDT